MTELKYYFFKVFDDKTGDLIGKTEKSASMRSISDERFDILIRHYRETGKKVLTPRFELCFEPRK